MVSPVCCGFTAFCLPLLVSVSQASPQGQAADAKTVPAPQEGQADPGQVEPLLQVSEPLPASAIHVTGVESWDVVFERAAKQPPAAGIGRERNGAQGTWVVPSRGSAERPHSGTHFIANKWGDTHMGIGFAGSVDLAGAWVAGMGSLGSWSPAVRALGYLDGALVESTEWFTEVGHDPTYFPMNLVGVDRVVIESRVAYAGAGFFGLDDLSFTPQGGELRVLDFEDQGFRTNLTGSQYAGLDWETGTGGFDKPSYGTSTRAAGISGQGTGGTTFAAGGGGTAPTLLQDFNGPRLGDAGAGYIPPDTCGAVGTDHFVSVVNQNISIYSKATGQRLINTPLNTFMNGNTCLDPRVCFDPDSQRFIVLGTNFSSGQQVHVAVSSSDDATGTWFKFSFQTDGGTDAGRWPDYPTLGVDQRGIYSSAYMVGGSARMTLFALEKGPLVAANPSVGVVSAFRNLTWEGAIQPAVHWDDDGGAYCVSVNGSNRLRVRKVLPPLTNPTLAASGFVTVGSHPSPPDAPAMGSNTPLDTVGDRLMNAVYRDGSLWTAHCVGSGGRSAARWYEIDPNNLASTVQQGTIADPVLYFLFPTIAVNGNGDVVVGMSASHSGMFVGAWATGRKVTDPAGQMGVPFEYRSGAGAYNRLDGSGRNRWGDYSLTSADPTDDTFWTLQERALSGNNWGTTVAQLEHEQDAIVNYCTTSPNSAAAGGSQISSFGSASIAANDLALYSHSNPGGQFGLFFFGDTQVQNPVGNGFVCVGGNVHRFPAVQIGPLGTVTYAIDNGNPPPTLPTFAVGETWNFQFWLRDPAGGGSNFDFSDGLSVTFQP
ncbi:MAG: hypothetical protein ACI8QC_001925 [Planctomycetota bacterium]|jgi:hypothetical protein